MIFAEIVASNINWTLIATIIMAIGTLGLWLDARRRPVEIKQPVQTQKVWPSATVKELESSQDEVCRRLNEHEAAINSLRELIRIELPAMERRITGENEQRAVSLHNRINAVLEAVSELRGRVQK